MNKKAVTFQNLCINLHVIVFIAIPQHIVMFVCVCLAVIPHVSLEGSLQVYYYSAILVTIHVYTLYI